jgi:hypothetical protein
VPAPLSDLTYTRAHARRRPPAGRRAVLGAAGLLLLALLAYGGYRGGAAVWHRLNNHETTSSHKVSSAQLGALKQVSPAYTDDSSFQHRLLAGAAANDSPSPAPAGAILDVPYTVQAPGGNWKVHEESCEEAALLMYRDFLLGDQRADIPAPEADAALRAMKSWQVQNWGAERDLTLDRTGQLAQAYWGYRYQLIPATIEGIKAAVSAGHPVVVPVMTHSLQNPHYGPNTVYHEVVIKGYNAGGVVTNDAGVQEGKNWFYSWSILFKAIDDQTGRMNQGRVALVLTTA